MLNPITKKKSQLISIFKVNILFIKSHNVSDILYINIFKKYALTE